MKTYTQLQGDGGSNILGQVVEQRQKIGARLSAFKAVLAVASGKGGVGKSTLSMLLALGLQRAGRRVALLDADFNGPSLARLGGVTDCMALPGTAGLKVPRNQSGLGILSFGSMVPEPQPVDFPSFSKGDSFVWRASKEFSVLGQMLALTDWSDFDVLLLDLPPGSEKSFQYAEFLGKAAQFILISLPSDLSRGVVARSHTAIGKAGGVVLGYIENMSGYYCAECGQIRPLFKSAAEVPLDLPCLGSIPFDPELAALCDRGLRLEDLGGVQAGEALESICGQLNGQMPK